MLSVCASSELGKDLISWVYVDGGRKILLEIDTQYREDFYCQVLIEQIKFEGSKAFWSVQVFDAERNVADIVLAKSLTVGVLSPILRELKNEQHIGYLIDSCKKFNRKMGV